MERAAAVAHARARELIERVHGEWIVAQLPLVFGERASGRLFALEEHQRVVSACALLVRDLVLGPSSVRVGLIGAVTTDPAYRGRGWATTLLARATQALAHDGCTLALLWADDARFYEARGFQPIGAELDFELERAQLTQSEPASGVRAAALDDGGAIHRLYTRHRARVDRSMAETRALLASPGIETLVLQLERDVVAYTCLGRGRDFARTIHEWGGAEQHVLALARAHVERAAARGESSTTYLIAPGNATELECSLSGSGARVARGILAHGMLLDLHGAAALLTELAGTRSGATIDCAVRGRDLATHVTLEGPRGTSTIAAGDLLALLLPARGDRARVETVEAETGLDLSALPLPAFIWGLDSI